MMTLDCVHWMKLRSEAALKKRLHGRDEASGSEGKGELKTTFNGTLVKHVHLTLQYVVSPTARVVLILPWSSVNLL